MMGIRDSEDHRQHVRRAVRGRRGQLSESQWREVSQVVCWRAWDHLNEYLGPSSIAKLQVAGYRPMGGPGYRELDPTDFLRRLRKAGSRVGFPRVVDQPAPRLDFHSVEDIDRHDNWTPGAFGIEEPSRDSPAIKASEFDLVVVPAVAVCLAHSNGGSTQINRLGYGKGFYDRFTSECVARTVKIALVFDLQTEFEFEAKSHDQALDLAVTERKFLKLPEICARWRGLR